MKKFIILLFLGIIIGVALIIYFQSNKSNLGWPTEPGKLVEHLNSWPYKEEMDIFERPQEYPDRTTNGETGGWIIAHKEKLKKLNVKVEWDYKNRKYTIIK